MLPLPPPPSLSLSLYSFFFLFQVLQNWWHETADAIVRDLVHPITIDGHDMVYISPGTTQSHLECFTGGMFAIASQHADTEERKDRSKPNPPPLLVPTLLLCRIVLGFSAEFLRLQNRSRIPL